MTHNRGAIGIPLRGGYEPAGGAALGGSAPGGGLTDTYSVGGASPPFQKAPTSSPPNATAHIPHLNATLDPLHRYHHSGAAGAAVGGVVAAAATTAAAAVAVVATAVSAVLPVSLYLFWVPHNPVNPCTGRLSTTGVESMCVISRRLTLAVANSLLV